MSDVVGRLAAALADRYHIERELGQGGMATVYLAHDMRHDRKVALKVLRPELAAILGGERFLQEIRTTANLQHPHILPLHDSGQADGTVYYVMPYVEGESLRDRLTREKQLPVEDAVRIAREIAGALDYAHRHGVVHRDIKPENILLHDGSALVADFGIALAVSTVGGGKRMTETGMSLGTPHYMAPEQAMGDREVTPRADVYALGVVLYEMLTGDPPFTGSTAQAIVARVVTESPRGLVVQRHTIPPNVEAAVLRALEKLPADRFGTATDFAAALGNAAFTAQGPMALAAGPARRPRWRSPWTMVPTGVAAVAVLAAAWAIGRPESRPTPFRFGLALPASQAPIASFLVSVSRDGSRLLYYGPAVQGAGWQLWVKFADRYDAVPIAGTDGATFAVFSPDGDWVAYSQQGSLKKVRVTGGAAVTLADNVTAAPALVWLDDGTLLYGSPGLRVINRIPATGGATRVVWQDSTVVGFRNFTPLPGSRAVLLTRVTARGWSLHALDLRDSVLHDVQAGALRGFYVPTGHVVYVREDGAMLAIPFDLRRLEPRGEPVPVQDSVAVQGFFPLVDISAEGTLVLRTGYVAGPTREFRLVWVDRSGRETQVDTGFSFRHVAFGANAGWSLSPDGTRLALGINTAAGDDIWVKQLPNGPAARVTFDSAAEYRPRWLPDGRTVIFGSNRPENGLYRRRADGTGSDELVLRGGIYEGQLSRDGRWLLARAGGQVSQAGGRNIGALRVGTDTALTPLIATSFDESEIALSPGGEWLAYVSDETGRPEVFIRPFPNTDAAKYQVSSAGGVAPLWARSGRELFFVNANREMVVIPVNPGATLRLGPARTLFRIDDDLYPPPQREYYTPWDISPDGRRFIMARRVRSRSEESTAAEAPLVVTRHWFEELRQKLGPAR